MVLSLLRVEPLAVGRQHQAGNQVGMPVQGECRSSRLPASRSQTLMVPRPLPEYSRLPSADSAGR